MCFDCYSIWTAFLLDYDNAFWVTKMLVDTYLHQKALDRSFMGNCTNWYIRFDKIWTTCTRAKKKCIFSPVWYSKQIPLVFVDHYYVPFLKLSTSFSAKFVSRGKSLWIVGYHFSFWLTATLNFCPIYLKLLVHVLIWFWSKSDKD